MKSATVLAARRAANAEFGSDFLQRPADQQRLLFEKHGDIILDNAPGVNLQYFFPSAVGSAVFYFGRFEAGENELCRALLESKASPVILDVGANIGTHSIEWARSLPNSQIYAFEPARSTLDLLIANVQRNDLQQRITVKGDALASTVGTAEFFESTDSAYSSLRPNPLNPVQKQYTVPTTTVDAFIEDHAISRLDLLKIDVEGFESDVLRGATATLEKFSPMLFLEVQSTTSINTPEDTIAALADEGYVAYVISDGIPTVLRQHDDLFYNYLFVREGKKRFRLPVPDWELKRSLDAERIILIGKLTADLQKSSETLVGVRAALGAQLNEKDSLIERLAEAPSNLEHQLLERDQLIAKLTAAAEQLTAQLEQKDAANQQLRAQTIAVIKQLEEKDTLIERISKETVALRMQLDEKDRLIVRLSGEANTLSEQLDAKDSSIDDLSGSARALSAQLQEKDALIERLSADADGMRQQLDVKESALIARTRSAAELYEQLIEKDALIEQLSSDLRDAQHLHAELASKEDALQALHRTIGALHEDLAATQREAIIQQQAATERLVMIEELNAVSIERLRVIKELNALLLHRSDALDNGN